MGDRLLLSSATRRTERARIVLGCGLSIAFLVVICAVMLLWDARRAEVLNWEQTIANLSTTVGAHAEQTMNGADLVLASVVDLTHDLNVSQADQVETLLGTRAVHEALADKVSGTVQVDVAAIMRLDGTLVNFSRDWPPPHIDIHDRDYIRALSGAVYPGTYLSNPVRNRTTGEWTFYLARQIIGAQGQPIAIASVGISSRYFQDFYRAANLGAIGTLSLFRTDGVLMAREPAAPDMIGQVLKDEAMFPATAPPGRTPAPTHASVTRLAGRSTLRIVAPRALRTFPLVSSIAVTEDVILATWRRTARNVAILTLGFVSALLGATLALMRLFDRQDRTLEDLVRVRQAAEDAGAAKTVLIEKLRASEAELGDKSRVLGLTLDHIDQGLLMIDVDGRVAVFNRRVLDLLDLPHALLATRPHFSAVVEHQRAAGEFVAAQVTAGHVPGEAVVLTRPTTYERHRPNGTVLEVQSVPLPDGGMVRTFTDITQRRQSEEQVRHLAHHDSLTQLANRLVFLRQVGQALDRADRRRGTAAVLYLDLDGFKLVNDTYGHAVGDRLLTEVAGRLRRVSREGDTVARMGGDEFAIVQPSIDSGEAAHQLAARILAAVQDPYAIGELTCSVGLSIGVALYPDHGGTAEELLRSADVALYRAKGEGKGVARMFDPAMDWLAREATLLEREIAQGLSSGAFFVEYQPIVDATTLRPACYEALVRWQHPERGVVGPEAFIGLAERSGQIVPLGLWVLETACRQGLEWPADVSLSVNVSPVQFTTSDLVAQVRHTLERTGFPPGRLILEVTEGVVLEDSQEVLDTMTRLRALGVRFSLDDFGAAQSRLTYLQRFPFDVIKIDRMFIEHAVEQEGARSIVGAVLAIGRAFRLTVVAEGVEKDDQLALLQEMRCDFVQGFLTGPPARAAAVAEPPMCSFDGQGAGI